MPATALSLPSEEQHVAAADAAGKQTWRAPAEDCLQQPRPMKLQEQHPFPAAANPAARPEEPTAQLAFLQLAIPGLQLSEADVLKAMSVSRALFERL